MGRTIRGAMVALLVAGFLVAGRTAGGGHDLARATADAALPAHAPETAQAPLAFRIALQAIATAP